MAKDKKRLLVLFGNQLFPGSLIDETKPHAVFMAESEAMCRRYAAHRHKLVLLLTAMRSKADSLRQSGHEVFYQTLDDAPGARFFLLLDAHLQQHGYVELDHFETESPTVEARLQALASKHGMNVRTRPSPMFVTPRGRLHRPSHALALWRPALRPRERRIPRPLHSCRRPTHSASVAVK